VVEDDVEVLHFLDGLLNIIHWDFNLLRQLFPSLVDIFNFVNIECARVRSELLPDFAMSVNVQFRLDKVIGVSESIYVRGSSSIHQPSDALQTSTSINNLDVEVLARSVMEGLVLHEHHVADFKASDEVLNRRTEVAASSPDILNVSDFIRVNAKSFSQPSVVIPKAFILEILIVVLVVEDLVTHHDKARVMAACDANVI